MTTPALDVRNLVFTYPDGTPALRGLSFRIESGETVGLIGGNGAGKSTLLLHLNGTLFPTRGEVLIGDTAVSPETAVWARRMVGLVLQDPDDQLFMPTVEEDIAFGPLNAGFPSDEVDRRVSAALECVNMTPVRKRPPYRLSAGEKRAVAIATVLAMEPEILVLDEPSSHLDPRARRRLIEWLKSYDSTCLIATHDLELVVEICSRVLVLDGGRLVAQGPTVNLLNDESLMQSHGLERPHILRHRHPH